jgi:hypothetical protein
LPGAGKKNAGGRSLRRTGKRNFDMTNITRCGPSRKAAFKASRRDAPVVCASCGRQVRRRGRLQRYCSTRCRKCGHYAQKVRRGDFSTPKWSDTALGTTSLQKDSKYNALQRAKTLSSNRIFGPADVLDAEVFDRAWTPAVSSGGVAVEVGRLRARALVTP